MKLRNYLRKLFPVFLSFFMFPVYTESSFGSTNFVIGADSSEIVRDQRSRQLQQSLHLGASTDPIIKAFFTPDDDMRAILLNLVACEKKAIYLAAFLLTDRVIAQALIDARSRGVDVQIVTDQLCCKGRYGKARVLHDGGIDVMVYKGKQKGMMSNLMHNKFIVFKENILGRSIVWTGSFNFTNSARLRNQENVLLLDNQAVVERYAQQFDVLKSRCTWYTRDLFGKKDIKKVVKTKNGMHLHSGYKKVSVKRTS